MGRGLTGAASADDHEIEKVFLHGGSISWVRTWVGTVAARKVTWLWDGSRIAGIGSVESGGADPEHHREFPLGWLDEDRAVRGDHDRNGAIPGPVEQGLSRHI